MIGSRVSSHVSYQNASHHILCMLDQKVCTTRPSTPAALRQSAQKQGENTAHPVWGIRQDGVSDHWRKTYGHTGSRHGWLALRGQEPNGSGNCSREIRTVSHWVHELLYLTNCFLVTLLSLYVLYRSYAFPAVVLTSQSTPLPVEISIMSIKTVYSSCRTGGALHAATGMLLEDRCAEITNAKLNCIHERTGTCAKQSKKFIVQSTLQFHRCTKSTIYSTPQQTSACEVRPRGLLQEPGCPRTWVPLSTPAAATLMVSFEVNAFV